MFAPKALNDDIHSSHLSTDSVTSKLILTGEGRKKRSHNGGTKWVESESSRDLTWDCFGLPLSLYAREKLEVNCQIPRCSSREPSYEKAENHTLPPWPGTRAPDLRCGQGCWALPEKPSEQELFSQSGDGFCWVCWQLSSQNAAAICSSVVFAWKTQAKRKMLRKQHIYFWHLFIYSGL